MKFQGYTKRKQSRLLWVYERVSLTTGFHFLSEMVQKSVRNWNSRSSHENVADYPFSPGAWSGDVVGPPHVEF